MHHRQRSRLVLSVSLIMMASLLFGPVRVVPAQSQDADIRSILPPGLGDALSGVAVAGPETVAPISAVPGPSGPLALGADVSVSGVHAAPQNEPEISMPRWDNPFLHAAGANDRRNGVDYRCGAYFTTTGAGPWLLSGGGPAAGILPIPPALAALGLDVAGDPDLAWSAALAPLTSGPARSVLYYSCLAFKRPTSVGSIYIARSVNGGSTYTALDSGIVATGSATVFHDKESIAVDYNTRSPFMGTLYVCWSQFTSAGADILFRRSTTEATSFGPVLTLSDTLANSQGCDVAVGPNGDVYVTWLEFTTNLCEGTIRIRRSTNGGASFLAPVTVAAVSGPAGCTLASRAGLSPYRINNFPRIVTDRLGHVGVVFSSDLCYVVAGGVLACSVGLDIWIWRASAAPGGPIIRRVNNTRTQLDQHFPAVATSDVIVGTNSVTTHGNWFVCFNDRSFAVVAGDFDTACTHSHSDASTWVDAVQRVSDVSSFDGFHGGTFIGDYIGVGVSSIGALAAGGHIHPVFARNSAAGSGNMDIFSENATPIVPLAPANDGGGP